MLVQRLPLDQVSNSRFATNLLLSRATDAAPPRQCVLVLAIPLKKDSTLKNHTHWDLKVVPTEGEN